jgi:hypothetical protein
MIIAVVVAVIAIFGLPRLLRGGGGPASPPAVSSGTLSPLVTYVESHYQSPADYIVSRFQSHDIVFLGEFYKISQNVTLVSDIIPRLYKEGIRNLGIEYALTEDQARIDALLSSPSFNEAEARAITFDWVVTWGFKEYIDLYRAAWQLNSSLPKGSKPFRIVALSMRQNWEYVKTEKDLSDAEVIKKILSNGVPDAFMAQGIVREFVDKGEKALVYCGMWHAFTAYRDVEYAKNAAAQNLTETRRAGSIVFDRIGKRALTVLLHSPWPDTRSRTGLAYPAGGVIDALILALPEEKRSAGFDTAGTPMGSPKVAELPYASGHLALTLGGMCDGYVIQGPISGYRAVTPIDGFITEAGAAYAAKNFPGPKPAKLEVADLNGIVAEDARRVEEMLRQFR